MPFAKKTRREYAAAATIADQGINLSLAAKFGHNGFTHMLFLYLLREYRSNPTKTKAIFIWTRCIKHLGEPYRAVLDGSDSDPRVINIEIDECGTGAEADAIVATLKTTIQLIEQSRAAAVQMNRFSRVLSSASRVPNLTIFDAFEEAMLARVRGSVWQEIEKEAHNDKVRAQEATASILRLLPRLRTDLKEAGFVKVDLALAAVK